MGFPIRGARGAPLASARVIPVWLVCLLVKAACAMTRCVQVGRLGVSWDPGLVSLVQRWAMMRLKMRMRIDDVSLRNSANFVAWPRRQNCVGPYA